MTPEELMIPRFKAIAEDTSHNYDLGEMFYQEGDGKFYFYGDEGRWSFNPENYPHLFKKLGWWEERQIGDVPEYLKEVEFLEGGGEIVYVYKNETDFYYLDPEVIVLTMEDDTRTILLQYLHPATKEEYEQFTSK